MPVITFKYQDLKDLGIDMEKDELINTLPMMASDIEDYDDEEIKVEFFPNRPIWRKGLCKPRSCRNQTLHQICKDRRSRLHRRQTQIHHGLPGKPSLGYWKRP